MIGLAHEARRISGFSVSGSDASEGFPLALIVLNVLFPSHSLSTKLSNENASNIAEINRKIMMAIEVFKSDNEDKYMVDDLFLWLRTVLLRMHHTI